MYQRVMAHLAGPLSILCGWLATQITNHWRIFGSLGIDKNHTASAIFNAVVFAVGAGLTYLGHAKWFSNLATWWRLQQTNTPPAAGGSFGSGGILPVSAASAGRSGGADPLAYEPPEHFAPTSRLAAEGGES